MNRCFFVNAPVFVISVSDFHCVCEMIVIKMTGGSSDEEPQSESKRSSINEENYDTHVIRKV